MRDPHFGVSKIAGMVHVKLAVLWLVSVNCIIIPKQQRFLDINRSGLRQYWELISWQGLIKAKVKSMLPELPQIDYVLYQMCAQEAQALPSLAKCAVKVMEKRDRIRIEKSSLFKKKQKRLRKKKIKVQLKPELKEENPYRVTSNLLASRKHRKLKRILWRISLMKESRRVKKRRVKHLATPYIDALEALKEHFRKHEIVKAYYNLIETENSKLYRKMNLGITVEKRNKTDEFQESMMEVLHAINVYRGTNETTLSLLSPRLFSILPGGSESLLSPDILSFNNRGLISIPRLIEEITGKGTNQKKLLEWVFQTSGAGEQIMKLLRAKQHEIAEMASFQYPLVQRMSRNDYNWIHAKRTFTKEQFNDLDKFGFTYLTQRQQELVFKDTGRYVCTNVTTRRDKELWLENKIRDIADFDPNPTKRKKRQSGTADEGSTTLVPVAFANMVGEGVALELITLSPQAFVTEIESPEALAVYTLSPRAFLAAILSPIALVVRLLSPSAFLVEILSPRAFTPYILNPRAFLVEILTPRVFEPHIASPDVMVIDILSPAGLSPQVLSPEMGAVIILSPKFLSPRVASAEKFLVEILSPHILGGPHTSHDETVLSIGGGEHSHDHRPGDEGTAAHQEDIHIHEGSLEGGRDQEPGYNPFGFTLIPTIPPKEDFFQLNDLINPTIPPDGDVLGFKSLKIPSNGDILGLQSATLPSNFAG